MKLYNTRLLVSDFPSSFLFYRDLLGLKATFGSVNDVYADFETGGAALALFQRDMMAEAIGVQGQPAAARAQNDVVLVFAVDNVDDTYKQLQAQGVEFITQPQDRPDWGIRTIHFRDPDGPLLEIYSPLPA